MKNKSNHGGSRPGSGRKSKEPTVTRTFRVPEKELGIVHRHYGRKLNGMIVEWLQELVVRISNF